MDVTVASPPSGESRISVDNQKFAGQSLELAESVDESQQVTKEMLKRSSRSPPDVEDETIFAVSLVLPTITG